VTNPRSITGLAEAMRGADVLIAFSRPGPHALDPSWIASMARRAIVFACANPVPEIYPAEAKQAGAFIVATGRGDFPNQVNNSLGFPGILKGALLIRARAITDAMSIAAARSLARTAETRGLDPDRIVPTMDEPDVFVQEAAAVGRQAIEDGVAGQDLPASEIAGRARADIESARRSYEALVHDGIIREMETSEIRKILDRVIGEIRTKRGS
jgi:malate dehydrogenase (oxaloacetate-decarboxylating)